MQQGGLGRGLAALIPDSIKKEIEEDKRENSGAATVLVPKEVPEGQIQEIPLAKISANPDQPRKNFNEEELKKLAESIKEHGLLQPILVTSLGDGFFQIIAGERRFRASQMAGLATIRAVVKEADELKKMELALVENIQRENLNPIEEARAYQALIKEFHLTQEEISEKTKKGRSTIANLLRYLKLPMEIQEAMIQKRIDEGHAKIIAALEDPEAQMTLFRRTVKDALTVRDLENLTKEIEVRGHQRAVARTLSPLLVQKEKRLSDILGLKTKIKPGKKGGKIVLEYYGEDDLDRILELLDNENSTEV
jgi:ParB family chromosome partitioning protein